MIYFYVIQTKNIAQLSFGYDPNKQEKATVFLWISCIQYPLSMLAKEV